MKEMNVAIIGYKFMGKAHSNAWKNVTNFFDVPIKPVLKVACGRDKEAFRPLPIIGVGKKLKQIGRRSLKADDIDIVDISVPPNLHAPIAIAAAKAGKHIFCEKPISLTSEEAKRCTMRQKKPA